MKRIGPAAQAAELVQLGVGVHVALLSLVTANAAHSADPSWGPARDRIPAAGTLLPASIGIVRWL